MSTSSEPRALGLSHPAGRNRRRGCPVRDRVGRGRRCEISSLSDEDNVEIENLHRQILFGDSDVGHRKLDVAKRALEARCAGSRGRRRSRPRASLDTVGELVRSVHAVVDATDNFASRFLLADACRLAGVPVVHAAAVRWMGTAVSTAPQRASPATAASSKIFRTRRPTAPPRASWARCAASSAGSPPRWLCSPRWATPASFGHVATFDGKRRRAPPRAHSPDATAARCAAANPPSTISIETRYTGARLRRLNPVKEKNRDEHHRSHPHPAPHPDRRQRRGHRRRQHRRRAHRGSREEDTRACAIACSTRRACVASSTSTSAKRTSASSKGSRPSSRPAIDLDRPGHRRRQPRVSQWSALRQAIASRPRSARTAKRLLEACVGRSRRCGARRTRWQRRTQLAPASAASARAQIDGALAPSFLETPAARAVVAGSRGRTSGDAHRTRRCRTAKGLR